jgi:flagellar assembly protein FliH
MSDLSYERIRLSEARAAAPLFRPFPGMAAAAPGPGSLPRSEAAPERDAYRDGFEAGQAAAAAQFSEERSALLTLIANLEVLQSEPSEELAVLIAETVERLVRSIVTEASIDRAWLLDRAHKAAALVRECDEARSLCFHPDDIALLEGADLPLALVPDPALSRGAVRIDCSAGWIESGIALHLDALRIELGREERSL